MEALSKKQKYLPQIAGKGGKEHGYRKAKRYLKAVAETAVSKGLKPWQEVLGTDVNFNERLDFEDYVICGKMDFIMIAVLIVINKTGLELLKRIKNYWLKLK